MAIEKTKTGEELKKAAAKTVRKRKVVIGVDKTYEDVLRLQEEGHDLYFDDDEQNFLALDAVELKGLNRNFQMRYRMAQKIVSGNDVIGAAVTGTKGFSTDYDVRAGSAGEQTAVYGKDPSKDYYWGRPDKHGKHLAEGWVVDTNENTKTRFSDGESGTQKTVGGQRARELTLYCRPKEVSADVKKKKKEIRTGRLKKSQDSARETLQRAGAKILD